MSAVTLAADMDVPATAQLLISGGLELNSSLSVAGDVQFVGTQTFAGSGDVALTGVLRPISGTLTITSISNKRVKGTFSFDAENVELTGEVIEVRDGEFDVEFF